MRDTIAYNNTIAAYNAAAREAREADKQATLLEAANDPAATSARNKAIDLKATADFAIALVALIMRDN